MNSQTADPHRGQNSARACAECGLPASPGQSFCEGCGAVLSWAPGPQDDSGPAPADPPGAAAQEAAPAAEAARPDLAPAPGGAQESAARPEPRAEHPAADDDPDSAPTTPLPSAGPPPSAEPPASGATQDTAAGDTATQDAAAERARALLVPVTDPEPRPQASVAPVLPGRPVAARPTAHGPGGEPGDDSGVPCPWCGTGNRPDRHFCRRCAMSMEGRPEDPPRQAWWRRLPGLRARRVPWAGERPRLRRSLVRVLARLAVAVVLVLVAVLVFNAGGAAQAVRDHFTKRAPVSPDTYSASHSYPDHGPGLAFDKYSNTWWGPGYADAGSGQWIEADFRQPVDLLSVIITPGKSTQPADLSNSALPHTLQVQVTTVGGRTRTTLLTLDQSNSPQTRPFSFRGVTAVRFVLGTAYGASADHQVAIAEIEFFGPSTGG